MCTLYSHEPGDFISYCNAERRTEHRKPEGERPKLATSPAEPATARVRAAYVAWRGRACVGSKDKQLRTYQRRSFASTFHLDLLGSRVATRALGTHSDAPLAPRVWPCRAAAGEPLRPREATRGHEIVIPIDLALMGFIVALCSLAPSLLRWRRRSRRESPGIRRRWQPSLTAHARA